MSPFLNIFLIIAWINKYIELLALSWSSIIKITIWAQWSTEVFIIFAWIIHNIHLYLILLTLSINCVVLMLLLNIFRSCSRSYILILLINLIDRDFILSCSYHSTHWLYYNLLLLCLENITITFFLCLSSSIFNTWISMGNPC
jgi:hypothetical protein